MNSTKDSRNQNKKPSKQQALLDEGDRLIEEFNRQHRVKASEYVTKVYDIYKRAGLEPIDAWKRIIEKSEWAHKTLEPYKPNELKSPARVNGQVNKNKQQVVAVTTESGQVVGYDEEGDKGEQVDDSLKVREISPKENMGQAQADLVNVMRQLEQTQDKLHRVEKELKIAQEELKLTKEIKNVGNIEGMEDRIEAAEMEVKFLKGEDPGEKFIALKGTKADMIGQFYYGRIGTKPLSGKIQGLLNSGIKVVEVYMVAL